MRVLLGWARAAIAESLATARICWTSLSVPEAPRCLEREIALSLLGKCHSPSSPLGMHLPVFSSRGYSAVFWHETHPEFSIIRAKMMQAFVFATSTTRKGRRTTDKVVITAHASFCLASAKPWRLLHVCRLSDRPEQSGLTTQKLVVMSASALSLSLHINHPADSVPAGSPQWPWWIRKGDKDEDTAKKRKLN